MKNHSRYSRYSRILTLLLAITIITACKKENQDPDPVPTAENTRIKTIRSDSALIAAYQYDDQGRIIFKTEKYAENMPYYDSIYYSYGDGTIQERRVSMGVSITLSNGTIVNGNVTSQEDATGGTHPWNRYFTYDANGFLLKEELIFDDTTMQVISTSYQIVDGNISSISFMGVPDTVIYFPNTVNTIGFPNTGFTFKGKPSKNLPKQYGSYYPSYCSYEYDDQGRVKKLTITHSGGNNEEHYYYTYY